MPIRMSGLVSGLDTESIIKELMKAQSQKKVKIENKHTKLTWKQEKWKDLNTKIYALYTGSLSKMKLQGSFKTKKVTSSDEKAVTAAAASNAANGTHRIKVNSLASGQTVTGAKLASNVTSSTKLVDLEGIGADTVISFTSPSGKASTFEVTESSTINDFVNACKSAGLEASFNETQKRLYISSSQSGAKSAFTISASNLSSDITVGDPTDITNFFAEKGYDLSQSNPDTNQSYSTDLDNAFHSMELANNEVANTFYDLTEAEKTYKDYKNYYDSLSADDKAVEKDNLDSYKEDYDNAQAEYTKALEERQKQAESNKALFIDIVDNFETGDKDQAIKDITDLSNQYATGSSFDGSANQVLQGLGLQAITGEDVTSGANGFSVRSASDASVTIDGAEMTSETNAVTLNGVTYNLTDTTEKEVTITIANDAEAAYNTVKEFLKEYNDLLKEMNEAYDADTARGYEPLTDEQKEAMSEEQVEKWEKKIKDSLLRRDDYLGGLISSMKTSLMTSVEVNGKNYSLASFGITTSTNWTEKGLLHIYGDSEDATYRDKDDKLKKALEEDPDTVITVLTKAADKLASTMQDKMKATSISSALTFYNDKELKKLKETYEDDLDRLEDKLLEMENRYYKQFTAMEKAMSQLNSQSSQLAGLFGGTGQ